MKSGNIVLLSIIGASLLSACSSGSSSNNPSSPTINYTQMNYSGSLPTGGSTGLTGVRQVVLLAMFILREAML